MKRFPWHSLLIGLYVVLFLFAENIRYVKWPDVLQPLFFTLGGGLVIFLIHWLIFKDRIKAGIFTTVVILLFFSYGHYHGALYPKRIPLINVRFDHNFYKWSSLLICLLMYWRFFKRRTSFSKLNGIFNLVSIILLVMPVYKILSFELTPSGIVSTPVKQEISVGNIPDVRPSIYYLIMDAYGRDDVLDEIYGFDNSAFTNYLKDKGFYVASKSFANYNKTVLSIPSALRMAYLDDIAESLGKESQNQKPLLELIDNNETVRNLKAMGYTTLAFDAPILDYLFYDSADLFVETPGAYINLFSNELLNSSIIQAFKREKNTSKIDQYEYHRKKILTAFEKIQAVSKREEPFYVHGHILAPHQPFVFGENGQSVTPEHHYTCWLPIEDGRDPGQYRKEYIAQLKFINKKLIETVEVILKNSKTPPIIIIQGDHGPCSELTNTKSLEGNNFHERMPIINAYYFPDGDYSTLYEGISPVNSFRTVFNQYFGMDYPLLPDSSYYSTWSNHYDFLNVTKEAN